MRILLAIDDSPCSQAATKTVISQNSPANTKVLVLHVVDPVFNVSIHDSYGPASAIETFRKERLAQAEDMVKRNAIALQTAGFEVTTCVEEGDPKRMILNAASDWNADLIVMGSHGRSGMDRFLLGSVSEAVTRQAFCSIEIVRDLAAIQLAKERGHSAKCGHPACTCTTTSEKYCSAQCEAVAQMPDIDCRCGHPSCKGSTH